MQFLKEIMDKIQQWIKYSKLFLVIDCLLITFSTSFCKRGEKQPSNDHHMWPSVSGLMEKTLSCNTEPKGTNVT